MRFQALMKLLKKEIVPATGCTEPVAVAYAVAVAREQLEGNIELLEIWVDQGLYKNAMNVGIPGIKARGLEVVAALGFVQGDSKKGLGVLDSVDKAMEEKALDLVKQKRISIKIKNDMPRLFIEVLLKTEQGSARVITLDRHLNVIKIEKDKVFEEFNSADYPKEKNAPVIQDYTLEELLEFTDEVPLSEIAFLAGGVEMNFQIAQEGFLLANGVAKQIEALIKKGVMSDDLISKAQRLCSAAAEARMAGSQRPVMTTTGSGNHGITIFLTNEAVAQKLGTSQEKLLRALALSNLITIYIKSFTGPLSAMCGCAVAAGVGASAGVGYQMDGRRQEIFGAMLNMIGSIVGLICDGAKEGCAYKLALSAGWAVQSALLASQGAVVKHSDGILNSDFKLLFSNLGYVCGTGMAYTNQTILDVMCEQRC